MHEPVPHQRLDELELAPLPRRVIAELIEEQKRGDLLRSYGIEPRHRLLLSGPPGNGKTSVAEAIAAELLLPFYLIRYEGVVSSFLGETAARLDNTFEFARSPVRVVLRRARTNHGELLDRAAWRRFQIRAELEAPSRSQATRFPERLADRLGGNLGFSPRTLADKLAGASFADLKEFATDVRRRASLDLPDSDLRRIVQKRLEHRRAETRT